ncbi:hypothetical protein TWF281_008455 [Arthrobotrys megalospora]
MDHTSSCSNPWPFDKRKSTDSGLKIFTEDPIFIFSGHPSCLNRYDSRPEERPVTTLDSKQVVRSDADKIRLLESTISLSQRFRYKYVTACVLPIEVAKGEYEFSKHEQIVFKPTDTVGSYARILSERMKYLAEGVLTGQTLGTSGSTTNNEILKKNLGTKYSTFEFEVDNHIVLCNELPVSLEIDCRPPKRFATMSSTSLHNSRALARPSEYQYY